MEHSTDDQRQYYIIEKDPLVNRFISIPKDKGTLNCAAFNAGILEGVLDTSGFVSSFIVIDVVKVYLVNYELSNVDFVCFFQPAKVIAQWHNDTTYYIIKFDEAVINRDKQLE